MSDLNLISQLQSNVLDEEGNPITLMTKATRKKIAKLVNDQENNNRKLCLFSNKFKQGNNY